MSIEILILEAVKWFFEFLIYAILFRAILSWFLPRDNYLMHALDVVVEPVVTPFRKLLYNSPLGGPGMMIDFSPILAYIAIIFAEKIVISLLLTLFIYI